MNSDIAYYLVLLYVTVMFKPLIPIISDAWAHEFNEVEHVSTIHAKYGSNHLQKELTDTGSDTSKNQNSLRSEDQVPFHVASKKYSIEIAVVSINKKYFPKKFQKLSTVPVSKHIPPPKFS